MGHRWTGRNDAGSQEYKPGDKAAVIGVLRNHEGPEHATTAEEVATAAGVNGRALRHIFSDIDGVDVLLGFLDNRIYLVKAADQAEAFTRRLANQATKMMARVERRRKWAEEHLDRPPRLF